MAPATPDTAANCFPFGSGKDPVDDWTPFMGFVYKNLPAFTLHQGDLIAFDLSGVNNDPPSADPQFEIAFAPTTVNGGDVPAQNFATLVKNTQTPLNPRGDTVVGNFELTYTDESAAPFVFPGGGLIIRFGNPSASYLTDTTCSQVGTGGTVADPTGFFVKRVFVDADGTAPWPLGDDHDIAGFRLGLKGTCQGRPATRLGTESADQIQGTAGADVIVAYGGDDRIFGLGGNDVVCGGAGKDTEAGGPGADDLSGENGKDTLKGGAGKDKLKGGPGRDKLRGGKGPDILKGGAGKDNERQ